MSAIRKTESIDTYKNISADLSMGGPILPDFSKEILDFEDEVENLKRGSELAIENLRIIKAYYHE